ncbi:NB-ARC domain disease resistance protein, partial [Trifolium medium]|nr:NB-ARC domain disease resistance protein [Trifolium medium]
MNDTSTDTETDHGFQVKSSEQGSSSSAENFRKAPFYMQEEDVVGFDDPKNLLIDWLVNGSAERTVVSVVAM